MLALQVGRVVARLEIVRERDPSGADGGKLFAALGDELVVVCRIAMVLCDGGVVIVDPLNFLRF